MNTGCLLCGEVKKLLNHHISYYPEIVIPICSECHGDIRAGRHPELKPPTQDFYNHSRYHSMYLSKKREQFIQEHADGKFSKYVGEKIDEDLAKLLDVDYCKKQKEFWEKQIELAKKKKKRKNGKGVE